MSTDNTSNKENDLSSLQRPIISCDENVKINGFDESQSNDEEGVEKEKNTDLRVLSSAATRMVSCDDDCLRGDSEDDKETLPPSPASPIGDFREDSEDENETLSSPPVYSDDHFHDVNTSPDLDSTEQSRDRTSSWSESGGDSEDDKETFSNESPETSSTKSTAGSESSEIPDGEWEVEEIVDFVRDDFDEHYHVKWKDWDADENTWETRKNLRNCETELLRFYRKRKEEARQALACTEYVELANGKRRKKVGVRSVPPDPRPFDVRVQEFYDVSGKLAEEDILKAFQECTNKSLSDKPRWPLEKVNKFIEDGADGKLSSEDVKALKDQLILMEVDSRNTSLSTDIEKWEKHINAVTGGRPKITIVNEIDTSGPPIGFEFRNEYVAGDGVSIPTDPPLGCDCGNGNTSCYDGRSECCAVKSSCKFAYTKFKKVKVRQGNPIYECNSKCKCGPECANRVLQDGKSDHKLCIFRTSNACGWGVKSLKSIKKGTFVTLYVGEVIQSEEAERRGKDYDEVGCTYLFDLDFNDTDDFPYSVDASKYGNVAHFINHSCSPNLGVYAVWVDCLDVNLPKLAMFALTDIRKNEELTFDYDLQLSESKSQSEEENEKEKVEKETPARKNTKCLCGAENCRKFIFK